MNGDSLKDLLLAGNNYSAEVETGRNDAGIGLTLINKGNGAFFTLPVLQSGFFFLGDVKCLEKIILNKKEAFIVGKNSDKLQIISSAK